MQPVIFHLHFLLFSFIFIDKMKINTSLPFQDLSQYALVKPCNFTPSIHMYHNPYWVVPLRYRNTCFDAFQYNLVGLTLAWLSWLNA